MGVSCQQVTRVSVPLLDTHRLTHSLLKKGTFQCACHSPYKFCMLKHFWTRIAQSNPVTWLGLTQSCCTLIAGTRIAVINTSLLASLSISECCGYLSLCPRRWHRGKVNRYARLSALPGMLKSEPTNPTILPLRIKGFRPFRLAQDEF